MYKLFIHSFFSFFVSCDIRICIFFLHSNKFFCKEPDSKQVREDDDAVNCVSDVPNDGFTGDSTDKYKCNPSYTNECSAFFTKEVCSTTFCVCVECDKAREAKENNSTSNDKAAEVTREKLVECCHNKTSTVKIRTLPEAGKDNCKSRNCTYKDSIKETFYGAPNSLFHWVFNCCVTVNHSCGTNTCFVGEDTTCKAVTHCDKHGTNCTACYTLNSDFFWYGIGDVIGIGGKERLYYCFPQEKDVVSKARLAAEELYKLQKGSR